MSRRIPGREPSFSGSVQLRAWRSPVVSTPAPPPPDGSGPVDEPLDRQWTEYLAAPTREARDRLVVRYTPLVRVVAHRVLVGLPTHVDHADLTQSGIFGLIDAIERFDPQRCPRFESFAVQRIRGRSWTSCAPRTGCPAPCGVGSASWNGLKSGSNGSSSAPRPTGRSPPRCSCPSARCRA